MKSTTKTSKSNKQNNKHPQAKKRPAVPEVETHESPEQFLLRNIEEAGPKGLRINAKIRKAFKRRYPDTKGSAVIEHLKIEGFIKVDLGNDPNTGKNFTICRIVLDPVETMISEVKAAGKEGVRVDEAYAEKFEAEHGVSVFEVLGTLNRMRVGKKRRPVIDLSSEEEATIVTPWKPKTFDFEGQQGQVISCSRRGHRGRIATAEVTFARKTLHLECHKGEWTDRLGNTYKGVA